MSEKSYVTLERHVCVVCGRPFDTNALLLDTRLRERFEKYTCTGWGLCPAHRKLQEEGYVALIECDPQKSGVTSKTHRLDPSDAYRTGRFAHLKREVFSQLFNVPCPEAVSFIEPEVMEWLIAHSPL